MPIPSLILKSFNDKLVWFKYESSLMEGIHIITVAAVSVLVSVCHMLHSVLSVAVVHWSGRCFLPAPWKSYSSIVTLKILHKKPQILQSCFPFIWFVMLFVSIGSAFFFFDKMSGFSSVFIPSCVNDRSNSVVGSFGKQLSILSESRWLVCCWERR